MRRLFSKFDLQTLGFVLALVVLSTTLPSSVGIVIISDHGQPEITENICQPLQTFSLVFNILLARPAPAVPELVLCDMGSALPGGITRTVDRGEAPDTPPPRLV